MIEYIQHRVNTIEQLQNTPKHFGVEVDIRSQGSRLIIQHDPFKMGLCFEEWLACYDHGTLILNVKEEGLEPALISYMADIGCEDYFFLDQSFPFILKYADRALGRSAVRFSEFESAATAIAVRDRVSWVWVDCFSAFPLTVTEVDIFNRYGFKTCVVSPELQNRNPQTEIRSFVDKFEQLNYVPNAVCTKVPDLWMSYLVGI